MAQATGTAEEELSRSALEWGKTLFWQYLAMNIIHKKALSLFSLFSCAPIYLKFLFDAIKERDKSEIR